MGYMNGIERFHRLLLELIAALLAYAGLGSLPLPWRAALSLIVAHTASMVFNGHLFALFKHDLYWFGFYHRLPDFVDYIEGIQRRLTPVGGLERAIIFGSLTRGEFTDTSDLDLRLISGAGPANAFMVANVVWLERLRALFAGFPIDIYMFRSDEELEAKMNLEAEQPIYLVSRRQGDHVTPRGELQGLIESVQEAHSG